MEGLRSALSWTRRHAFAFLLGLQAFLLLYRPDLLPPWGDEVGTLQRSAYPIAQIPGILRSEIHPPLYYFLVHFWLELPLPAGPLVKARLLSALLLLAATVLIDRLWLRQLESAVRIWWLGFWTLSPCLLLYGRMARSYTLSLLLGCLALWAALQFFRQPLLWRRAALYAAAATCLLYTHYAPGLAVAAGLSVAVVWKSIRQRSFLPLLSLAAVQVAIAVCFLPWLGHLRWTLGFKLYTYSVSGNALVDHLLNLGYWFFSFHFGETPPLWVLALAILLAPALAWLLWRGVRSAPDWLPVLVPVAAIAYLGVADRVTFVFVPARLLFLLPFAMLLLARGCRSAGKAGAVAGCALLAASMGSIHSYFSKENFLNKSYVIPGEEIARLIDERSRPRGVLLVVDGYNTNIFPALGLLKTNVTTVFVGEDGWEPALRRETANSTERTIWYVRNTHDISPGGVSGRLDAELAAGRELHRHLFVEYSAADRFMMRLLGWRERPRHMIQVLELRPAHAQR